MDLDGARDRMIRFQLLARGIHDVRVIAAMRAVPREEFVRPADRAEAHSDGPLEIGEGQTISQPYIVAAMLAALELRETDRVLEVGAGSGYAAAVVGRCAREVWAIERHASLEAEARARMERLGYANVHVVHGDGTRGLPAHAPYDAILVSAGGPEIPSALMDQLADGGRMVIPVGSAHDQTLVRVRREGTHLHEEPLEPVRFVPLVAG